MIASVKRRLQKHHFQTFCLSLCLFQQFVVHLENPTCYSKWSLSCFQTSPLKSMSAKWLHFNSGLRKVFLPMGSQICNTLGCFWSCYLLLDRAAFHVHSLLPMAMLVHSSSKSSHVYSNQCHSIGDNDQTAIRKCYQQPCVWRDFPINLDIDFQKVSLLSYWKKDYGILLLLIEFQICD